MHLQYLRSRSRHLWPAAERLARSLSLCSPRLLPQLLLSSFLCFARWKVFAAVALPAATRFGLFAALVAGVDDVTCCVVCHVASVSALARLPLYTKSWTINSSRLLPSFFAGVGEVTCCVVHVKCQNLLFMTREHRLAILRHCSVIAQFFLPYLH